MYLLSCPNCHADIPVTPAQAGDAVQCPACQQTAAVPTLGKLKQLPRVEDSEASRSPATTNQTFGSTVGFVAFSLIALATLLATGYNAVRWATTSSGMTTEKHLEQLETAYRDAEPALLVVEFADMERQPLEMIGPYQYQVINDEKARWGRNALIAGGITALCAVVAVVSLSRGRERVEA